MPEAQDKTQRQILWVDDEIDMLRSHIIFLADRGYEVTPATNGEDAVSMLWEKSFDIVLLDEMMAGMDGLSTLNEIKNVQPTLPVVMVTKSEEEELMNEAISKRVDDFLVKPVNPSQIISACKRILDARQIRAQRIARDYVTEFRDLETRMHEADWSEWIEIHSRMSLWDLEIHSHNDESIGELHHSQVRNANRVFSRYVENNYRYWLEDPHSGPILSPEVVKQYVMPHVQKGALVYYIVIDCLRLDQWLALEPLISEFFAIRREHIFSILPTATPFARNALFAGKMPREFAREYPDLWHRGEDDERSLNRYEEQMLKSQLAGYSRKIKSAYTKIIDTSGARSVLNKVGSWKNQDIVAMVFNFLDHMSHGRSESEILQEITPDEAAYRTLTVSWFSHSVLFDILKWISRNPNAVVVVTTDHGSVLGTRSTVARGNRQTSTNLRYKFGTNLVCEPKEAVMVQDPKTFGLPRVSRSTNFIVAKEDYYFIYPTRYHEYDRHFRNSFQHGGISMEEMIVPVVTLLPKG